MAGDHPTQSPNKGLWIRGSWLRLLTNQLNRLTAPSITPALRFGLAVDNYFSRKNPSS